MWKWESVCVFVWTCGGAVFKYQRELAAPKGRRRNDWCRRQTFSATMFPLWVCRLSSASLWSWRQEIRKLCRGFVTFTIFFHFDTFHFLLCYFTVLPCYPKWSWDFFFMYIICHWWGKWMWWLVHGSSLGTQLSEWSFSSLQWSNLTLLLSSWKQFRFTCSFIAAQWCSG